MNCHIIRPRSRKTEWFCEGHGVWWDCDEVPTGCPVYAGRLEAEDAALERAAQIADKEAVDWQEDGDLAGSQGKYARANMAHARADSARSVADAIRALKRGGLHHPADCPTPCDNGFCGACDESFTRLKRGSK